MLKSAKIINLSDFKRKKDLDLLKNVIRGLRSHRISVRDVPGGIELETSKGPCKITLGLPDEVSN